MHCCRCVNEEYEVDVSSIEDSSSDDGGVVTLSDNEANGDHTDINNVSQTDCGVLEATDPSEVLRSSEEESSEDLSDLDADIEVCLVYYCIII